MKYNRVHHMFNDMMNFAIRNGMTSYQSDLMHDAVELCRIEDTYEAAELLWIVKSNGCGTWMWNYSDGMPPKSLTELGVNVHLKYYGDCWVADFK